MTTLTERQHQVLVLLSDGFTTSEIGKQLGLSGATINVHRKSLLQKFNARNVASLIKKACQEGFFRSGLAQQLDTHIT